MTSFQAVYYRDANGVEPVRDFISALDDDRQVVLLNQIDRLNLLSDQMPHLPFPTPLKSTASCESYALITDASTSASSIAEATA